jgi:protein ImuB
MVARRPLVRRIYKQPVPLAMHSDTGENPPSGDCIDGPYVMSGGWWSGGVHRDYYFLHTTGGDIWWVYYDRRRERFFLQGRVE